MSEEKKYTEEEVKELLKGVSKETAERVVRETMEAYDQNRVQKIVGGINWKHTGFVALLSAGLTAAGMYFFGGSKEEETSE